MVDRMPLFVDERAEKQNRRRFWADLSPVPWWAIASGEEFSGRRNRGYPGEAPSASAIRRKAGR